MTRFPIQIGRALLEESKNERDRHDRVVHSLGPTKQVKGKGIEVSDGSTEDRSHNQVNELTDRTPGRKQHSLQFGRSGRAQTAISEGR